MYLLCIVFFCTCFFGKIFFFTFQTFGEFQVILFEVHWHFSHFLRFIVESRWIWRRLIPIPLCIVLTIGWTISSNSSSISWFKSNLTNTSHIFCSFFLPSTSSRLFSNSFHYRLLNKTFQVSFYSNSFPLFSLRKKWYAS